MLFHITMTHTPENCPTSWSPEEQQQFFAKAEKMNEAAKEMNIDIRFMLAGIGHTMYALIDASDFNAMNLFFSGIRLKQDYHIEPVGDIQEVMTSIKAEVAKR